MADLNDDIDKYLHGKLSPSEMHALEKKALNEPFLAEALQGAGAISPEDFKADVAKLQQQIGAQSRSRKVWSYRKVY